MTTPELAGEDGLHWVEPGGSLTADLARRRCVSPTSGRRLSEVSPESGTAASGHDGQSSPALRHHPGSLRACPLELDRSVLGHPAHAIGEKDLADGALAVGVEAAILFPVVEP